APRPLPAYDAVNQERYCSRSPHFDLHDPTRDDIRSWAHDLFETAATHAVQRLSTARKKP
ncbi:hypothetical protein, partial [Kineosporia babensis]